MHAADTNVLVRLITRDDEAQLHSAEEFIAPGAWVSHIVLVETMWVLDAVYELDRKQIATATEMLLNHRSLAVQGADVVAAALLTFRRHAGVGFSDCLALEVARRAGHLPVGTFDRQFARLPDVQRL